MTTTAPVTATTTASPAPAPGPARASSRPDPAARLSALLDPGTSAPLGTPSGCGVLTARGRIAGMPAVAFASDPAIQGGAMGAEGCEAIVAAYRAALAQRCPVIGLWHSGGARLAEGVVSLDAVGRVFAAMTEASGVVPQISVALGAAAGGAAYGPALTDVIVMAPDSKIFVTGPDVIRSVTGEDVDAMTLGGPGTHAGLSGLAHVTADDERQALGVGRRIATLLGAPGHVNPAVVADRDLGAHLPERPQRAYDVRPLVADLLDPGAVELAPDYAPNIVTTLGRLGGGAVGVLANNPLRLGGCLDSPSAEKAAKFVRTCDAFGVPLVVLVDVPGYLPGTAQEQQGVVRRGAKLLHAFAAAAVPRVTVVTRKAFGGAYIAMNSRSLGSSHVLAWPSADVAVMGPLAAVRILHRRKLAAVSDEERPELERTLAEEHERSLGGVDGVVAAGVVDEVIDPATTRGRVAGLLHELPGGSGEHGNIPL